MGKSVRINLSLPAPLHELYAEVAQRTGISLPQVLVDALKTQGQYTRRWLSNWNFQPRDTLGEARFEKLVASAPDLIEDADGDREPPAQLTRQQRRAQQRALAKER